MEESKPAGRTNVDSKSHCEGRGPDGCGTEEMFIFSTQPQTTDVHDVLKTLSGGHTKEQNAFCFLAFITD